MCELPVHIRWMIRRDLAEVLAIEEQGYVDPWAEEDFVLTLRRRNVIGMVAEQQPCGRIVGYMIYELQKRSLLLLNMAVDGAVRRSRVGTQMIAKLKRKLSPRRRVQIVAMVADANLPAQLFLRAQGFRARGYVLEAIDFRFVEPTSVGLHASAR